MSGKAGRPSQQSACSDKLAHFDKLRLGQHVQRHCPETAPDVPAPGAAQGAYPRLSEVGQSLRAGRAADVCVGGAPKSVSRLSRSVSASGKSDRELMDSHSVRSMRAFTAMRASDRAGICTSAVSQNVTMSRSEAPPSAPRSAAFSTDRRGLGGLAAGIKGSVRSIKLQLQPLPPPALAHCCGATCGHAVSHAR